MYVVMTRVRLHPGTSEQCADLFRQSNPGLVGNEPDWQGAQMIFDGETDIVTVLATWSDVDAYRRMSQSHKFKATMSAFSQHFASAPVVTVNDLLVDMRQ
jgi:quinol monooxygenase YgiN